MGCLLNFSLYLLLSAISKTLNKEQQKNVLPVQRWSLLRVTGQKMREMFLILFLIDWHNNTKKQFF